MLWTPLLVPLLLLLTAVIVVPSHSIQAQELQHHSEDHDDDSNNNNIKIQPDDESSWKKMVIGFVSEEARDSYGSSLLLGETIGEGEQPTDDHDDETGMPRVSSLRHHLHTTPKRLFRYSKSPAVAMPLSPQQIEELSHDPRIAYLQPEVQLNLQQTTPTQGRTLRRVSPTPRHDTKNNNIIKRNMQQDDKNDNNEIVPLGIKMVQGRSTNIPPPMFRNSTCSNPRAFKVCVIDTGLFVNHEDIPYNRTSNNIEGMTLGLSTKQRWYNVTPRNSHGTHVTGTILAQAQNGVGVVGILPKAPQQGICLLVAHIYDSMYAQDISIVSQAMEWCSDKGAKIINLSAATDEPVSQADADTYQKIVQDNGVLVVAAAGNGGTNQYSYPASWPAVLSVGAVTSTLERASFSQYNDQVDLVAPGVGILSTISSHAIIINATKRIIIRHTSLLEFSVDLPRWRWKKPYKMVNCGRGFANCTNAAGKVCVIQRGTNYFAQKALNCQAGGGIAVLLFNNAPGTFGGNLRPENREWGVRIPVFALSQEDGWTLMNRIGATLSFTIPRSSYGILDGTSMATAHVTGVAAKIWAARPACTHTQIRRALEQSALDLGPIVGRDNEYGHGLVQAEAAFDYLVTTFAPPCGGVRPPTRAPVRPPTRAPIRRTPTRAPGGCRANSFLCTANSQCCSGRCVATVTSGNGSKRCQRRTSTRTTTTTDTAVSTFGWNGGRDRHHRRLDTKKFIRGGEKEPVSDASS